MFLFPFKGTLLAFVGALLLCFQLRGAVCWIQTDLRDNRVSVLRFALCNRLLNKFTQTSFMGNSPTFMTRHRSTDTCFLAVSFHPLFPTNWLHLCKQVATWFTCFNYEYNKQDLSVAKYIGAFLQQLYKQRYWNFISNGYVVSINQILTFCN